MSMDNQLGGNHLRDAPLRKTHPMVLIAAVALTIFSLLGSAAITGLIPTGNAENESSPAKVSEAPEASPSHATGIDRFHTKARPADDNAQPQQTASLDQSRRGTCTNCGRILSIRTIEEQGEASGLGAVAGGVAGGVLGNQIGKGRGNTLMTVLGVGGGAYAGHEIEKNMKTRVAYVIEVEMHDGTVRKVTQYSPPEFSVGDRVQLKSGQLVNA
jgi:outer membrane lipoprotein SlyB